MNFVNTANVSILITLVVYGAIIMLIAYTASKLTNKLSDYVLGGRSLTGPIAALGAGASDMSSWLLMALPGLVYTRGLSMVWMPVALTLGAYLNWRLIAKRLRVYTEIANDSLTLPAFLSNRFKEHKGSLRLVTAIAIFIFFVFYSVAGFVSGAIVIEYTFGISYHQGLIIIATVIISYTALGGFLAVNWVDFFQGVLMFISLLVVPIITIYHLDGANQVFSKLQQLQANHLNLLFDVKFLSITSLFAWGLGYFGQPHINARFMAVRSTRELPSARRICMNWMVLSLLGAVLTGLVGFVYYYQQPLANPDTVFLALSRQLFNPWIAGILLSAVVSAIMSTVSAQILMSSNLLVEDIYHGFCHKERSEKQFLFLSRVALVLVSICIVILSMDPERTILQSVAFAWSGLGAAFGPVTVISLYWRRMTKSGAIAGIVTGMTIVLAWELLAYFQVGWFAHPDLLPGFVILPGAIASIVAIVVVSLYSPEPEKEILDEFDKFYSSI